MDLDDRSAGEPGREPGEPDPQANQPSAQQAGEPGRPAGGRIRTGRNLPVAIGVGLFLGACTVVTLYTVKATFLIYMGVAVGVAGWELSRALGSRHIRIALPPLACGCAAIWTCAYWISTRSALAALALTAVTLIVWRLPGGPEGYLRDLAASMFALAYLPLMAVFAVLMLASPDGPDRLIVFIAVTICSDVGGYFTGIIFGRHLLVPTISPKKTWEGLGGSVVACVACGATLMPLLLHGHLWQGVLLGLASVTVATLGDMAESMIKRDLQIKDMGALLPGHGGLLDRLDSMLMNAPVAWLLLAAFVPASAR